MAKGIPAALSLNIFERNIDTRQTLQTARLLVICLLVVAFFFLPYHSKMLHRRMIYIEPSVLSYQPPLLARVLVYAESAGHQ